MNYCGKCGQELKDIHLNGNCPECGISLINHKEILKQAAKGYSKLNNELANMNKCKKCGLTALPLDRKGICTYCHEAERTANKITVHLFGGPKDGKKIDFMPLCGRHVFFPDYSKVRKMNPRQTFPIITYKIEQDPDIKDLFYGIYQE